MKELTRANPEVVEALTARLFSTFEDFCNERADGGNEAENIDGLMAAHNFHCLIALDTERRLKLPSHHQLFHRKAVVDTFKIAMENEAAWTQEPDT